MSATESGPVDVEEVASVLSNTGTVRDPERLLAGYRADRAQEPLFEMRSPAGPQPGSVSASAHDEFVDETGEIRPLWRGLGTLIGQRGRTGLVRLREVLRGLVEDDGISYIEIDRAGEKVTDRQGIVMPGPWRLDGIPLLLSAADWEVLQTGLAQRARVLNAVLTDLYGEQRALTSGVLPPRLLFGHPGYIRAVRTIAHPGPHPLFMLGCDVSRDSGGRFLVNADSTQAPSGAGYALADRRVLAHAVPDLYEQVRPRPVTPFAQALRLALIDAAPEGAEDPTVVVLTPGIHSETSFDQAHLATLLGFPLVESADLVMRDGALWMRSLGTLKRVDVVLRRVDADYADPLDLRPDSRLGVVGLVEAQRRGTVTVVNGLGAGVLESPGVRRFLPELARLLIGEDPLLESPPTYWGGIDTECSHLLTNLSRLVIASTTGGPRIVGPALSAARRQELAARISAEPWQWVGEEPPQFSTAPTGLPDGGLTAASVGMRLFTVSQRSGYTTMVGGLGYVLAPGPGAFTLNRVAAKDIWVRSPARATIEQATTTPSVPLPSGTQFISSPRVLADLFWIGRYAERAEGLARLLIVSRERYHEYRNRPELEGSACVPVLIDALRQAAGDEVTADGSKADAVGDAPQTMWSLTADRLRSGSLAHSVECLGLAARAVRDQMSNDTWMVLGAVERALTRQAETPPVPAGDDTAMAVTQQRALAGMLALSGMAAESMVRDPGWTLMDIGKRIERGLGLTTLLRATLTIARSPDAEQAVADSVLVACESSVLYRRRNLGQVSVAALTELLLFDENNPRSLVYQLDRLRANLRALPSASGSSRSERAVEEISARLRRVDPAELEHLDSNGRRRELDGLLDAVHGGLSTLSDVITATTLSLPDMQPLWGPDQRRVLP